jgi:hypothetical protein
MLCIMLREISNKWVCGLVLSDLPHTYSCTCFCSTKETKCGNKNSTGLSTGEFKPLLTQSALRECGASKFFLLLL